MLGTRKVLQLTRTTYLDIISDALVSVLDLAKYQSLGMSPQQIENLISVL